MESLESLSFFDTRGTNLWGFFLSVKLSELCFFMLTFSKNISPHLTKFKQTLDEGFKQEKSIVYSRERTACFGISSGA